MATPANGIGVNKHQKGGNIGRNKQRMKNIRKKCASALMGAGCFKGCAASGVVDITKFYYSSFLNRATGIFSCSRYLATVRRAIL